MSGLQSFATYMVLYNLAYCLSRWESSSLVTLWALGGGYLLLQLTVPRAPNRFDP